MTDHKFTDEEIVELLRAYVERQCGKCNVKDLGICCSTCFITAISQAADLINRQKAEIDDLKVELDAMRGAANSYKMHYEEAQAEIDRLKDKYECIYQPKAMIKAEAIKEFAERLKPKLSYYDEYIVDALVKEVTENKQ